MAYFKIVDTPEYSDPLVMRKLIHYIMKPEKTENRLIGGYNLLATGADEIIQQMEIVKQVWHKTKGKQIRHFLLSFSHYEKISEWEAWRLSCNIATYYADLYQILFVVHENSEYVHIHFVFNPVCIWDGRMYARGKEDYMQLGRHIFDELNFGVWREKDKKPNWFLLNGKFLCW